MSKAPSGTFNTQNNIAAYSFCGHLVSWLFSRGITKLLSGRFPITRSFLRSIVRGFGVTGLICRINNSDRDGRGVLPQWGRSRPQTYYCRLHPGSGLLPNISASQAVVIHPPAGLITMVGSRKVHSCISIHSTFPQSHFAGSQPVRPADKITMVAFKYPERQFCILFVSTLFGFQYKGGVPAPSVSGVHPETLLPHRFIGWISHQSSAPIKSAQRAASRSVSRSHQRIERFPSNSSPASMPV